MELNQENINLVLEKIRPYLKEDNGDVEFVAIDEGNVVKVRLMGACYGCAMSLMTLRAGIERYLMREIPDVSRVESVD
jgi:Fe-S cluster biogenesis protein NfuA